MVFYLLKRILVFVPTLFAISLLAFFLSKIAPGDPVLSCNVSADTEFEITPQLYRQLYEDMGLDQPVFYFQLTTQAHTDTLHRIPGRYQQVALKKLTDQYGDWSLVEKYHHSLQAYLEKVEALPDSIGRAKIIRLRRPGNLLLERHEEKRIQYFLRQLDQAVEEIKEDANYALMADAALKLQDAYGAMIKAPKSARRFIPQWVWYGTHNQYHSWITSFVQGDFGISCRGGRPVLQRIKTPIFWTIILSVLSMLLTYILAVPLGVFSAVHRQNWKDRLISTFLFFLYSLPTFWIATMLLVFFTTPEYGMDWFEGAGLGNLDSSASFWARFWETARHLLLPVICLTYPSLAFVSRQMRGGMLEVLGKDYIRTARAKGVGEQKVIWKHAFRNALFPLLTLFAAVFPAIVTGSVVIEVIFNIPGMGREVISAIFAKDWPVLYAILMIVAFLTMLGNLIVDILYAAVDPRVKY